MLDSITVMPYKRLYRRYRARKELLISTGEGNVLLVGIALVLLYMAGITIGYMVSPGISNSLVIITVTNIIFGRAAGMALGYSMGFGHGLVVPLNMFIETVLVLIFYPVFVMVWRHLIVSRRLGLFMERVRLSAERHENVIRRYGLVGLGAFVWIPFSMTGPMVGCVIGYMMGLSTRLNLGIVITSTWLAILSWAILLKGLLELAGYGTYAPITIVTTIIAGGVIVHLSRRLRAQKKQNPRKPKV